MSPIFILFFSYLTSFFGYSLGKATKEEHNEIKIISLRISYLLQLTLTFILLFLNINVIILVLSIISLFLIYFAYSKNHAFLEFNAIFLFVLSFFSIFNSEFVIFSSLAILSLIIENSFKKFNLKEEIYKLIILLFLGIIFMQLF